LAITVAFDNKQTKQNKTTTTTTKKKKKRDGLTITVAFDKYTSISNPNLQASPRL
jgi:hypothetical protein